MMRTFVPTGLVALPLALFVVANSYMWTLAFPSKYYVLLAFFSLACANIRNQVAAWVPANAVLFRFLSASNFVRCANEIMRQEWHSMTYDEQVSYLQEGSDRFRHPYETYCSSSWGRFALNSCPLCVVLVLSFWVEIWAFVYMFVSFTKYARECWYAAAAEQNKDGPDGIAVKNV